MQAALRPASADPAASAAEPFFPPQLLARLDKNGPRYTSYPTADRYRGDFGVEQYRQALRQRRDSCTTEPLSLYVHIPFCDSVCYYCACNKVVTRHHDRAARYLDALAREIALHVAELGPDVPVSQLHFGGGTPTFLSDEELDRLMADLRGAFRFEPDAEISIDVYKRQVMTCPRFSARRWRGPPWRPAARCSRLPGARACLLYTSTSTELQICAATRRSWVMNTSAIFRRCCSSCSSCSTWACTDTSSADTDSSATSTLGSSARARAMPMRWRWPPENWLG